MSQFRSGALILRFLALGLCGVLPQAAAQNAFSQDARIQVAQATAEVRLLERTGQLRAAQVAAACNDHTGQPRLQLLKDGRGLTRIVRFERQTPDHTLRFTAYLDATGRLRYATGRASGYPGELYNLSAEYDEQGARVFESGKRRAGWASDLRQMPGLNLSGLLKGQCIP
ncbi:hypothetical protein [Deinococcus navajonensis]|uniref:MORN repeat protein n=1 Tax=Deinococcus navajonensis TaxID=309884 RepID=A0ABV8XK40_9DEIO